MSLKVKDFCSIMEQIAPRRLCENYDNVGLMVGDFNNDVSSILVALDCTLEVIEEAISENCDLIFTHHPLLFNKAESVTNETLLGKKIIKLIKNDINVFSSHTNLDSVVGGINDRLVELLGFGSSEIIEPKNDKVFDAGIGRIVTIKEPMPLIELCNLVKSNLKIPSLRYVGEDDLMVQRIAIVSGSGSDYIKKAIELEADCIISGDISYHYASDYNEIGFAVIDAGHFYTEWFALKEVGSYLQSILDSMKCNVLVKFSNSSKNPYKTK